MSAKFSKSHSLRDTLLLLVGFVLFFNLASCNKEVEKPPVEWQNLISYIPRGEVSRAAPLKIRFNQDMIAQNEIGNAFKGELQFEPHINGEAIWSAANELSFTPKEWLEPGFEYRGSLSSKNIPGLNSNTPNFYFNFKVFEQSLAFKFNALESQYDTTLAWQSLSGTIETHDVADTNAIEKVLTFSQNGNILPIEWTHIDQTHTFLVKNIQRTLKREQIKIIADGTPVGVAKSRREETWQIPSLKEFVVLSANPLKEEEQGIEVVFSDPINNTQILDGLVKISNQEKLRYFIDGNKLKIFFNQKIAGKVQLQIDSQLKNIEGNTLDQFFQRTFEFNIPKPKIRFLTKGILLPPDSNLSIAIEAISLKGLRVRAFKVFANNMGQFLQNNALDGSDQLQRVGRYLWEKDFELPQDHIQANKWNTYHLDIKDLIKKHKGELLRLEISFEQSQSTYPCTVAEIEAFQEANAKESKPLPNWDFNQYQESSGWDGWSEGGYWSWNGSWGNRENPCKQEYYNHNYNNDIQVGQNFLATNIGLIAKISEGNQLFVYANSMDKASPESGVKVEAFNFQNQVIGSGVTDIEGQVVIQLESPAFYVRAYKQQEQSFLKINPNSMLTISHFDIGGQNTPKGLKGYLYGERGVWRPGDTLHLSFYLEDLKKVLPPQHPLHFKWYSPSGQLLDTQIRTQSFNGFYTFKATTEASAPTGNYRGVIEVGGQKFSQYFKVETIVPNRLKIELNFKQDTLLLNEPYLSFELFSQYLHGAKASELQADIDMNLSSQPIAFSRFSDYTFSDPTRTFYSDPARFYEGQLDKEGRANVVGQIIVPSAPASILRANFTTRVHERSGGFSISRESKTLIPYPAFVGIQLPKGDQARNMLLTDTTHYVKVATIDPQQKSLHRKVRMRLYKIDWKWWWDKSAEDLGRYAADQQHQSLLDTVIETQQGAAQWGFKVKYPDWGRYLVQACDQSPSPTGLQHCSSQTVYIDWPGWAGKAREGQGGAGAAMLTLSPDKPKYETGDLAKLQVTAPAQSRALLTIEKQDKILTSRWLDLSQGSHSIEIPITEGMAPNVYASVTLLQAHQGKMNDLPIRLYGVVPLHVEDPATHLQPVIESPEKVRPQSTLKFKVREANGRPMTYTLALVDEGLLGLTRFKVPHLWNSFYKKEALEVNTWDLYDDVVGAYGQSLERLIALGGDEAGDGSDRSNKNRFAPLVRFSGPFELKEGDSQSHEIDIPEYLGAVRLMVVAAHAGAYGSQEAEVKVKQPLMIQTLAPRILGPDEEVELPVTVFAMEPGIQKVQLKYQSKKLPSLDGLVQKTIAFSEPGEQVISFRIKTPHQMGDFQFTISANGGGESYSETLHLKVRSPNPQQSIGTSFSLEANQDTLIELKAFGLPGTQRVSLEASSFPQLKIEQKLSTLIAFPHGCLEQTTSKSFAQLFLTHLAHFSDSRIQEISNNIRSGIQKLKSFQNADGSFSYWPGQSESNAWAEVYAGHFLIEAQQQGYTSSQSLIESWYTHQKQLSGVWWSPTDQASAQTQAYRLYAMALYGKPDLSAMNRLNEQKELDWQSASLLGMAYWLSGQKEAAQKLIRLPNDDENHSSFDLTFRSRERDLSIALLAFSTMQREDLIQKVRDKLFEKIKETSLYSTQTTTWMLTALSRSYDSDQINSSSQYEYQIDRSSKELFLMKQRLTSQEIPSEGNHQIHLKNRSAIPLYFSITQTGIPVQGEERSTAEGLELTSRYTDLNGNPLSADKITHLKQGSDIVAWIDVKNTSSQKLDYTALTQVFPVGWEIKNTRLDNGGASAKLKAESSFSYRDFRDDRVLTYFELRPNEVKSYAVVLHATYPGKFYQPATIAEDMYLVQHRAILKGQEVTVDP